ncbi:hypothetical protein BJ742DRAFT_766189 [Cladochytrium replicatum]|nr:hypothetical protein BJ742DRAFT_766189 [Cladochytrium replicatum]
MKDPAQNKFLIYQPREPVQQVLGITSACATLKILNCTLVLPRVGYRDELLDDVEEYPVAGYMWKPFERYFDPAAAPCYPCSTITLDNFLSLRAARSLGTLWTRFTGVSPAALDEHQRYIRVADYLMETRIRNLFGAKVGSGSAVDGSRSAEVLAASVHDHQCPDKQISNVKKRDVIFVATNSNRRLNWQELVRLAIRARWKTVVNQQQLVPWSGGNNNISTLEIMLDEKRTARKLVPKEWRIGLDEVQSQMGPIYLLILDQHLFRKADAFMETCTRLPLDGLSTSNIGRTVVEYLSI